MELDISLSSSFHGFPDPDFLGFDPALSSTRVLGEDTPSFLKENTFDYSGSSKPDINLSTSSSQSMSSINSTQMMRSWRMHFSIIFKPTE